MTTPTELFNNSLQAEDLHFHIPSVEVVAGLRNAEDAVATSLLLLGNDETSKNRYPTLMSRLEMLAGKVLERAPYEPLLRTLAVIYLGLQGSTGSYFMPGLSIGMSTAFADPELAGLHFAFLESGAHAQLVPLWKLVCARGPIFGNDSTPVDISAPLPVDPRECDRFFSEQFARGMDFLETCKTRPSPVYAGDYYDDDEEDDVGRQSEEEYEEKDDKC